MPDEEKKKGIIGRAVEGWRKFKAKGAKPEAAERVPQDTAGPRAKRMEMSPEQRKATEGARPQAKAKGAKMKRYPKHYNRVALKRKKGVRVGKANPSSGRSY